MDGLKSKLKFIVYVPMMFVFLGNAYLLYLSNSPVLLVANVVFFFVSLIFARMALNSVAKKVLSDVEQMKTSIETLSYCSNLINMEINKTLDEQDKSSVTNLLRHDLEYISLQMKELIVLSLQQAENSKEGRKELLTVAKQLGKLCTHTRQVALGLQEDDPHTHKLLLISDNMMNHILKLTKICGSNIDDEIEENRIKELPLKTGTLRRVMKVSQNSAA